jgi:excisionase family DNA binding protein
VPAAAPAATHDIYRRFLAASEDVGAGALRLLNLAAGRRPANDDNPAEQWARDAAPVILDRIGAALLAGDATVLLDYLREELADLRRTGISEVHLLGLLDALSASLPHDLDPAGAVLAEGRDRLVRAGAPAVRAVGPAAAAAPAAAAVPAVRTGLPGQAFTDLLLLGALACQAPVALLSVPQPGGSWRTLQHGLDTKEGSNDGQVFEIVAASTQPVEIPDLKGRLPRSPLALPPHSLRWAYGTALRLHAGTLLGVVVLLDRWLREASKREQRALVALARQLGAHLAEWTRPPGADPVSPVRSIGSAGRSVHPAGSGHPAGPVHPAGSGASDAAGGHRSFRGDVRSATTPGAGTPVTSRHDLLRSQEVAEIFDVTDRTVINWAAAGKLPSLRTIGGHLRFRREDVLRLLTPAD